MILKKLELINFRNYSHQEIEFSPDKNLIIGRNAQGKSNLLEAVYFLSYLKSNRVNWTGEIIMEGESRTSVRGFIMEGGRGAAIRVGFGEGGKAAEVNGQRIEPAARARGILKCVMFAPDDLYLVKGDPSKRRKFLEETMEGTSPVSAGLFHQYRHLLKQRNAVIKRWEHYGGGLGDALEPWDMGMSEVGGKIIAWRLRMVGRLEGLIKKTYAEASESEKKVEFEYRGTFEAEGREEEEIAARMRTELAGRLKEDKQARATVVGPHRDEVEIRLGGRGARYGASQGELRTLAFCMRMAQRKIIEEETGKKPVLLLDDVLSELDEKRREKILGSSSGGGQLIITATELLEEGVRAGGRVFTVEEGKLFG